MIRNLTTRRVASALNHAASGSRSSNTSTMTVRCLASTECSMNTPRRSYHSQRHHSNDEDRRVRSSSPSPAARTHRPLSYQVQSPKLSQTERSYATSSPILVEAAAASVTHECPIRHLHDSFYEPPLQALYDPHYQEEESISEHDYTGYVASGAVETTFSATTSTFSTTDGDMDAIADDEEWLPIVEAPAAEQVLAMMDTSYYHASYRAKSHSSEE